MYGVVAKCLDWVRWPSGKLVTRPQNLFVEQNIESWSPSSRFWLFGSEEKARSLGCKVLLSYCQRLLIQLYTSKQTFLNSRRISKSISFSTKELHLDSSLLHLEKSGKRSDLRKYGCTWGWYESGWVWIEISKWANKWAAGWGWAWSRDFCGWTPHPWAWWGPPGTSVWPPDLQICVWMPLRRAGHHPSSFHGCWNSPRIWQVSLLPIII